MKDKNSVIFSVIVPTHGRADLLKNLFLSIRKASIQINNIIEVIIIDDSISDEKNKIIKLCEEFETRYIDGPSSVREKRNLGITEAKGEIIFFVDSDCEVSENIFIEHLKMYEISDTAGVLGLTEFIGKKTCTWKIVERTKFLDAFSFAKTLNKYIDSAPWGTCTNLSLKRDVLNRIGGFEVGFPFRLGGDDTELGIRINKAGYKIKMNPNAVVYHTRETWNYFSAVAKRIFRWGRMDYHVFFKKHNDKTSFTSPKAVTVFSFMVIFGVVKIILGDIFIGLLLPFFWLMSFLFICSSLKIISSRESIKNFFLEISAQFLQFLFDIGTVIESIKSGSLKVFVKSPMDNPRQIIVLWGEKVSEAWSILCSALVILIIIVL